MAVGRGRAGPRDSAAPCDCSNHSSSDRARRRTASCSARTSPTSVTTTAASPAATPPTTSGGPEAAAARSSSRGRASTSRTGPTSGRRSPSGPAPGWADIVAACRPHGAARRRLARPRRRAGLVGLQPSCPLWAPSRVPEVASREVPKWMEAEDITAVIDGFVAAAAVPAIGAGATAWRSTPASTASCASSCPGLTNQRGDEWGADRLHFARTVITAVRAAVGADHVVGLRLSCDEIAPWAGITPEMAPPIAADLVAAGVDYVVVVRGIDLLDRADPSRLPPTGRVQRRASPRRSPRPSTCRSCCRARSSTSARPSGPSAATTTRPRARRSR